MSETTLVTTTPATQTALRQVRRGVFAVLPGLLLTAGVAGLAFELRRLPGVKNVNVTRGDGDLQRLHIYPKASQSILSAVSQAVNEQHWRVEELYVEKGHLDEVFRAITTKHQAIS